MEKKVLSFYESIEYSDVFIGNKSVAIPKFM